jgi:hypothetical protein
LPLMCLFLHTSDSRCCPPLPSTMSIASSVLPGPMSPLRLKRQEEETK